MLFAIISCAGGGVSPTQPHENTSPPVWNGDEGILSVEPDDSSLVIEYGSAHDPDGDTPIRYKLYYCEAKLVGDTDPFINCIIKPVYQSPYALTSLENEKKYCLGIRAMDSKGKEDGNKKKLYGTPANIVNFDRNLQRLKFKLSMLKTVCYAPTNFNPETGTFPSDESIRLDLEALYDAGFRGIVTYASDGTLYRIPRIAKEQVGFDLVIMGIWDPNSNEEKTNAKTQVLFADGFCVGNEGIMAGRYNITELENALVEMKTATNKPVTTSETWDNYSEQIKNIVDWCFPNAHPYWHGIKDAVAASNWVEQRYNEFQTNGKFLCFKETGMPSEGDTGLSEENQKQFFIELENKTVIFCYFEGFDQPWKDWAPVEPHWGLFRSDRTPKKIVQP